MKTKYAVEVNINNKLICILSVNADTPEEAKKIALTYFKLDAKKDGKA